MWILFALIMMVVALKAFSFSFTLALIPFAAGCWCFSKSSRDDMDTFMAFSFFAVLIGFALNFPISIWGYLGRDIEKGTTLMRLRPHF